MQYRSSFNINNKPNQNPFNSLMSLLVFVGVLVFLFFIFKGFVTILYWAAPVLLIITLIIRYRVVSDYAVSLFETFRTDVMMGVLKVAFTVLCYPFVIGWLFVKALFYRKMDKVKQDLEGRISNQQGDQYADYEEVSSEITDITPEEKPIIIELPKPKEKNNPYDNLFDS